MFTDSPSAAVTAELLRRPPSRPRSTHDGVVRSSGTTLTSPVGRANAGSAPGSPGGGYRRGEPPGLAAPAYGLLHFPPPGAPRAPPQPAHVISSADRPGRPICPNTGFSVRGAAPHSLRSVETAASAPDRLGGVSGPAGGLRSIRITEPLHLRSRRSTCWCFGDLPGETVTHTQRGAHVGSWLTASPPRVVKRRYHSECWS